MGLKRKRTQPLLTHNHASTRSWMWGIIAGDLAPNAQFNIYANTSGTPETAMAVDECRKMVAGVKYIFKFRTVQNNLRGSHYSLKVWRASQPEPANWDLQADGQKTQGSVLLGVHRVDVSFKKIIVVPLP